MTEETEGMDLVAGYPWSLAETQQGEAWESLVVAARGILMKRGKGSHAHAETMSLINETFLSLAEGGQKVIVSDSHAMGRFIKTMQNIAGQRGLKSERESRWLPMEVLLFVPSAAHATDEESQAILKGLYAVPKTGETYRSIIQGRCENEWTNQEVADHLGVSVRTVERHLQFIKAWVKAGLEAGKGPVRPNQ